MTGGLASRVGVAARVCSGAAMLLTGVWLLANTALYRQAEAWSTAKVVDATVGSTAVRPGSSTFFVGIGTDRVIGLRIDQLCSTGAICALMLIVTGLFLVGAGVRVRRGLIALTAMVGLVTLVNLVRITILSWSVTRWGLGGWFEWLHLYGGAGISMVAVAVGCGLYLVLIRKPSVPVSV